MSASAQPAFVKTFQPATIGPGSVSTLQFEITNSSGSPVRYLAFTDNLPSGLTIAYPAGAVSECGGTLSAPSGGNAISFSDGGIGAGESCTITVNVTGSTAGTYTNETSDLTSGAGNSGSATAVLTIATDRPGFTKSFSPSTVFFGDRSTLTITIDNTANSQGAANLSFTDNLPDGMVVASPANASTDCGGGELTAVAGSSVIKYTPQGVPNGTVAAGASCSVTVDVLGNSVEELGNLTGELTSTGPYGGSTVSSGMAGAVLTVAFEQLSMVKSFIDDPVGPGDLVTMEFTVRNLNRGYSASNIGFTDDLSTVLTGLTAVGLPLTNPCGSGSSLSGTSFLTLSGGSLGPGSSCTFSVSLEVPSDASSGLYTNSTSLISATINGASVLGSAGSDLLAVEAVPTLTKTFIGDPVGAGSSVELEFTITNGLDEAASDIGFMDELVAELPTASVIPADGFCGPSSTMTYTPLNSWNPATIMVSGASLEAGASCTFSITLDVAAGAAAGTYANTTSELTATVGGETATGAAASDELTVIAAPQLTKEFTDDPVSAGGTVTLEFTLRHGEAAPGDATDISFSDDLAAVMTDLVATGLPVTDVCGTGSELSGTSTIQFTGGSLTPGETCTFSVTVQVPATADPGSHTNTTSAVVSTVLGVTALGNPAQDDLKIGGLTLTKEFTDDPVLPGSTVNLRFTIENTTTSLTATNIYFTDDLDAVIDNMAATGLPVNDICGTGSSLTGTYELTFQGGTLAGGEQCSFDVTVQVPASAAEDTYGNTTGIFSATMDGGTVIFGNAYDSITVQTDYLLLTKEFTNDPVAPGDLVNLRFSLTNLHASETISDIAFTDDLEAALSGLASTSGTLSDVCGAGSQLAGSGLLTFTGGSLASSATCVFDVSLSVPAEVELGSTATNTTSYVSGSIGALSVSGDRASDELLVDFMTFSKWFDGEAVAGDTVTLFFNIQNLSTDTSVSDLSFTDDLGAVVSGMEAIGLPVYDVCGEGSSLTGDSFLLLSDGNLAPSGSCTFSVELAVPESAAAGIYTNVTSDLQRYGEVLAGAATASLTVVVIADEDDDGVLDGDDLCPSTSIPEAVPTVKLTRNRYALTDGDYLFDTNPPNGNGPGATFTTTDTAGCSCEQIIVEMGLGQGHIKFGCSLGAMRDWVEYVGVSKDALLRDRSDTGTISLGD
jgi:uncharacterized repeat protein (TIGR01451 family)